MKYFNIVTVALVSAMLFIPCIGHSQTFGSVLSKITSTDAPTINTTASASTSGKAAGAALKSLYTQYKADGKLDMTNAGNLLNLATLATNLQGLKGQSDKSSFYKDFASGLVLGSDNLVTSSNSSSVMSGLSSLVNNVDLSSLMNQTTSETSTGTTGGLSGIIGSLSGSDNTASQTVDNSDTIANSVTNILNLLKK